MKKRLIAAVGLFLAMTPLLLAQIATGVIRGTVQEVTGAVLIDVHLRLIEEARNQTCEQTKNEEGFFEFRALAFGKYRVEVEHPDSRKR